MPLPGPRLIALGLQPVGGTNWNAPQIAANLAAARLVNVVGLADGAVINLLGTVQKNDGGQGLFFYSSTSTATDDLGRSAFASSTGAGRWLRQKNRPATNREILDALRLACWGDSFTAVGALFIGAATGYATYNGGVGGDTSGQIKSRMLFGVAMHGWTTIIEAGRNNVHTGPDGLEIAKADIAEMVAALGHDRFVVLEIPKADTALEWTGAADALRIDQANTDLEAIYGERFLRASTYVTNNYNPALPQDVIDFNHGVTPLSLRADGIHYNDAGYTLWASYIKEQIARLQQPAAGNLVGVNNLITAFAEPPDIGIVAPKNARFYDLTVDRILKLNFPAAGPFKVDGQIDAYGDIRVGANSGGRQPLLRRNADGGLTILNTDGTTGGDFEVYGSDGVQGISRLKITADGFAEWRVKHTKLQSSVTNAEVVEALAGGNNPLCLRLQNNTTDLYFGIEGNRAGGGFFTDVDAWDSVLFSNRPVAVVIGATKRLYVDANGILVGGSVKTQPPHGLTAANWKFGEVSGGTCAVEINGVNYNIGVTPL